MSRIFSTKWIPAVTITVVVAYSSLTFSADKITPDEYEPNNNYKQAAQLDPEQQEWYEDLTITTNDHDWFSVKIQQGQTLHVKIFFSHKEANIDMSIFRLVKGRLKHIKTSAGWEDNEELLLENLPAGIYYVYHRDHGSPGRYNMSLLVH